MNKEFWEIWMEDESKRENDFKSYLASNKIRKESEIKNLVLGHIQKANHNLKFSKYIFDTNEFNDWVIVGAYYAIYQASLALCALKGFTSKDHSATLLILIKEFYKKGLNKEDINIIGNINLEKEDVLNYIESRRKRKEASYSTQSLFNKEDVDKLRLNAIMFVNKIKYIIDSYNLKK